MTATFEWLCPHAAILRLHTEASPVFGSPYVWFTVARIWPEGLVELKGADRPLPSGGARAICDVLRLMGFKRRTHRRRSEERYRDVTKGL